MRSVRGLATQRAQSYEPVAQVGIDGPAPGVTLAGGRLQPAMEIGGMGVGEEALKMKMQ